MRAYVEVAMHGSALPWGRVEKAGVPSLKVGATDFQVALESLVDRIVEDLR